MPRGRQIRMIAVALTFEMLQTIGALMVVFAPLLICYFAKYWVEGWAGSVWAGDVACYVSSLSLVASYSVGVGVGIAMLGWIIGAALSAISILVFIAWFRLIGVGFLDKMGARIFIMAGNSILEFLPYVNVLPWSTMSIWAITQTVRSDDREARKKYDRWLAAEEASIARDAAANDNEEWAQQAA